MKKFRFQVDQHNVINTETNDSRDINNSNQLNTFDTSNQIRDPTPQPQSLALPSTQNIHIAVGSLEKPCEQTNTTYPPGNLFDVDDYVESISKRQKLFDNSIKQQQYKQGDLVGLQVDRVDHTNATPNILPCKVVSAYSSSNDNMIYKVCTLTGVLSTLYGVQDLLDLRKENSFDLRGVDPTTLPTITFTEACEESVSIAIPQRAEACNCNGKCATKSCPCKAKHISCCKKCHPKKKHSCANIWWFL